MMKKWLPLFVLLLLVGAVGYVALSDVPVTQGRIEKTIPNNNFFQ